MMWVADSAISPAFVRAPINIADFNGDDTAEIYVGTEIYNGRTGSFVAKGQDPKILDVPAISIAADVLPDAFCTNCSGLELIFEDYVYSVDILGGTMDTIVSLPKHLTPGWVSIADMNGDELLDIVVSARNDSFEVFAWDPRTGNQIGSTFKRQVNFNQGGRVHIANFDDDDGLEMGVVTALVVLPNRR